MISGGARHSQNHAAQRCNSLSVPDERLILIEDTAEWQLDRQNVVRFEARREQSGLPAVTVRDWLRATLRRRPHRILVGEGRVGEAFDLLQALRASRT